MRILIVTANFAAGAANPWLLDDLAAALVERGHEVDVLLHDWKHSRRRGVFTDPPTGARVLNVGRHVDRGPLRGLRSQIAAAFGLHLTGARLTHGRHYDIGISTTIAALSWGIPGRLRRRGTIRRHILFLWDFFPVHQIDIGRIRRGPGTIVLKWLERRGLATADVIATMTPANTRFLEQYHKGLRVESVEVLPWSTSGMAQGHGPVRTHFTALFGGQLATGRGIETILEAARHLSERDEDIRIVIAGGGPREEELRRMAQRLDVRNVEFIGQLPREEYRELLLACHVGIAATVRGVTPPAFPSKIAEYAAAGKPVIVSIDDASDAGEIVESSGIGIAAPAGDAERLADALIQMRREYAIDEFAARAEAIQTFSRTRASAQAAAAAVESAAAVGSVHS